MIKSWPTPLSYRNAFRLPFNAKKQGLTSKRQIRKGKVFLLTGIVIALITEGIIATLLMNARAEISGYLAATSDQYNWLITLYISAKLIGFGIAPWFCGLFRTKTSIQLCLYMMIVGLCVMTLTNVIFMQEILLIVVGIFGSILLIASHAILFQTFPRPQQPPLQILYAIGAAASVIAIAPGLQGWILHTHEWHWILFTAIGTAAIGLSLMSLTRIGERTQSQTAPFDWSIFILLSITAVALAFIANHGLRWNWFAEEFIVQWFLIGITGLILLVTWTIQTPLDKRMWDLSIFKNLNFSFALVASFVAGFALFSTAFLIPTYAINGLGTSQQQITLVLGSALLAFIAAMLLSIYLFPKLGLPPVATVPAGICLLIISNLQFSYLSPNAGITDLIIPTLLRAGGVGFLYLAVTLLALMWMPAEKIAHGSALMAIARQLGGFIGIAVLGTFFHIENQENKTVLSTYLTHGNSNVNEHLLQQSHYLWPAASSTEHADLMGLKLLEIKLAFQAQAVAWNTTFLTVVIFFCIATPTLILTRLLLLRIINATNKS